MQFIAHPVLKGLILFYSLFISVDAVCQSDCNSPLVINDSDLFITASDSILFVRLNFKNSNTAKTVNLPCSTWSIFEQDSACSSLNPTAIFNENGHLLKTDEELVNGQCNCYSCSINARTFDSLPGTLLIKGTGCKDSINIQQEQLFAAGTPNWAKKNYQKGERFNLTDVIFVANKAKLVKSSWNELDALYELLTRQPALNIEIIGHVNGPKQKNSKEFQKLSNDRAKTVCAYLIKKGISANRITYVGLGNTKMLYPSPSNEKQMLLNRRVEVRIQ